MLRTLAKLLYLVVFGTFTTIAARITAFKTKRRMKRALGEKVADRHLTSIATRMKENEAEHQIKGIDNQQFTSSKK